MKNKLSQGNRILLMIIAIGLVCLVGIALAYKGIVSPSNSNENGDEQGGNDTPAIQVPSFYQICRLRKLKTSGRVRMGLLSCGRLEMF